MQLNSTACTGYFLWLALLVPLHGAFAEQVLYSFGTGNDGIYPYSTLLRGSHGELYGTTEAGGANSVGTVFRIAKNGTETVLYSFKSGASGGSNPFDGLIKDAAGNLYGTANVGGANDVGTVFKLAPNGTETMLYSFAGGNDGEYPVASLLMDSAGNLYGTTPAGGADTYGTVFKLAQDGTETVLHTFTGGNDGGTPRCALIEDKKGNLYGTTTNGGASGYGIVFRLSPAGKEKILYTFLGGSDGGYPMAGVIRDSAGNLYGTTQVSGLGAGTVFKLAPDGTETPLYTFQGGSDGSNPRAGVIKDSAGNLYGTTPTGGANNAGIVFKISSGGTETILHSFGSGSDAATPQSGLIADRKGHLYGTTLLGGTNGFGAVYKLSQ